MPDCFSTAGIGDIEDGSSSSITRLQHITYVIASFLEDDRPIYLRSYLESYHNQWTAQIPNAQTLHT